MEFSCKNTFMFTLTVSHQNMCMLEVYQTSWMHFLINMLKTNLKKNKKNLQMFLVHSLLLCLCWHIDMFLGALLPPTFNERNCVKLQCICSTVRVLLYMCTFMQAQQNRTHSKKQRSTALLVHKNSTGYLKHDPK